MSVLRKTREHYKGLDWDEELKKQKELRRGIDDRMIAKIQQYRTDRLVRKRRHDMAVCGTVSVYC